jgi:hypothetical protein
LRYWLCCVRALRGEYGEGKGSRCLRESRSRPFGRAARFRPARRAPVRRRASDTRRAACPPGTGRAQGQAEPAEWRLIHATPPERPRARARSSARIAGETGSSGTINAGTTATRGGPTTRSPRVDARIAIRFDGIGTGSRRGRSGAGHNLVRLATGCERHRTRSDPGGYPGCVAGHSRQATCVPPLTAASASPSASCRDGARYRRIDASTHRTRAELDVFGRRSANAAGGHRSHNATPRFVASALNIIAPKIRARRSLRRELTALVACQPSQR